MRRLITTASIALSCVLLPSPAWAEDGPIVGMPPIEDAVVGWVENWMDPDYWSSYVHDAAVNGYLNAPYPHDPVKPEALLPTVPVADGSYVSALPVKHLDLSQISYTFEGQTKTIEQYVRTSRTDQVVLVSNGTVIGEFYAGGYSADVRHQAWSVTKTFVAAVVGIAHHEGLVRSLGDPIESYIAELKGTEWEGVSVEDILQMESGVHWDEGTPVLAINTQVEQWRDLALDLYTEGAVGKTRNEFLATLPTMSYEPGTRFSYNSGNTQVLAWMTERLYGKRFEQILSEKLWQPMGAEHGAMLMSDRVGDIVASHGLFARPHDFARFGELLRNGGRTPEGRQVVPASWVKAMTTMTAVSDGQYGLQTWAHETAAPDAYSASGFQGQKITVLPSSCLTGVRTSHAIGADIREGEITDPNAYAFGVEYYAEEWQTMLKAIAQAVGGCTAAPAAGPPATGAPPTAAGGTGKLPATGGTPGLLAALLLVSAGAACRRRSR